MQFNAIQCNPMHCMQRGAATGALPAFYRFSAPIGAMVNSGPEGNDPEKMPEPGTDWQELPGALCWY